MALRMVALNRLPDNRWFARKVVPEDVREDYLVWDVIYPEAPESYHDNPQADPHWEWQKEPEVREAVRPRVAELARVATFLASEGKALNATAYALFVDAVSDNLLLAIMLLERRANGDYSRDDTPDSFPAFTDGRSRATGISCWDLFEAFVKALILVRVRARSRKSVAMT